MAEPTVSAPAPPLQGEFRVGRVFSNSLSILFRNIAQFMLLSAIASLPFLLVYGDLYARPFARAAARSWNGTQLIAFVLGTVLTALCQAVVLYGAFQVMRRRRFQIGESLTRGLKRFLPVIGTTFCLIFAMTVGFILLVVPGFIVLSMCYVALPACVVERLGPFQSLSRSSQLTKGHRWKVFGIYIVLMIGIGIGSTILAAVLALAGSSIVLIVGMFFWNTLARAIESIVAVVAYHDLRVAKEGVDIEHIASVFD
jgi:hypothetical protein